MLKIGTDCSGIEAPIQALLQLNIPFIHEFSSEIDKFARKTIEANYHPKILFEDMTKPRILPKLDVYVCGFPCQPFSMAGSRLGSEDPRGRIFDHCITAIKQTEPKLFILENVKSIMWTDYFNHIKSELSKLDYIITYNVLNTKDYGIPQNRQRLYIIGSLIPIELPDKIPCENINSYVDESNTNQEIYSECLMKKYDTFKDAIFSDISLIHPKTKRVNPHHCPTITTKGLWCVKMHRRATVGELLKLQGFNKIVQVVSNTQMKKQIGNSMSVNILSSIFKKVYIK
jgi:DNA (cytosine-5)-methyltransferase 1